MLTFKPWKIESILQLLLGLFGGIAFAGILAQALGHAPAPGQLDHGMMLVGAITVHGAGLLWLNWFFRDHELGWVSALGLRLRSIAGVLTAGALVGAVGFVVCSQLGVLMFRLLTDLEMAPESQSTVLALQQAVSLPWILMFGATSIVLAPIVEETLFRGILFPVIHQSGYPKIAWWGTSLFFAFSHANLQAMIPLTVLALMLTWLYVKTDSLVAPIIAHGTFNAINFILTLQQGALSNVAR
ncbi:MAG TPA: hypothetical protein DCY13_12180 [Verrucomicrobiales bacterium]|nr:hypothetical protein [Verrucomicrobiales bacterium]